VTYRTDDEDNALADFLDGPHAYDEPDVKGQHRRVLGCAWAGAHRYLVSLPGAGLYCVAVCGKCGRFGIDLSLLPDCTTGVLGMGDKL
jgi:hypothetical protein